MRELTFTIEYDPGVDPVMDACMEFPRLAGDAIASCVRRDRLWQVERFVGPAEALEQVERARLESGPPREEMTVGECRADRTHDVLERSATTLVIYSFFERLHTCDSVMALAARHLDLGHVFQVHREDDRQRFRLLMRSDENIDVFYDAVAENLREGLALRMGRLADVKRWNPNSLASVSLSQEERSTLLGAIEHGYYERPREVTVTELAERLDVPKSTVSYRLRQAEARLAKGYVRRAATADDQDPPRASGRPDA